MYKRDKKKSSSYARYRKKSRSTTKRRRGNTARRRYYGRKRARPRRNLTIPLGGIGIGAATFVALRGDEAMGQLLNGDVQGAIGTLGSNSVTDVVAASIPPMVYGMMKKAIGPVELFKFGRIRITI